MVSCKTRLFRGLCRMFRHMLRRNRVIERDPPARSGSVTSRGAGCCSGRQEKCPSRLEGHDEHSSFDQCDRPSTIGPIRKIRQSRFITVASGNVIVRAATNAVGLVEEVFGVAERFRGVLIDCDRDGLHMPVAPAFPRC